MQIIDTKDIDPAAEHRPQINYETAIFGDARCLGAWSFERSRVTQSLGGVASVANHKPGGVPLVQTDSARRPGVTYDESLRRQVAIFDPSKGQSLAATGLVWSADFAWTIIAVVQSTFGNGGADFRFIGGTAVLPDFAGLLTVDRTSFLTRTGKTTTGGGTSIKGRDGWNRIVAAQFGLGESRAQANEGPVAFAGPAGNGFNPTTTLFRVGDSSFAFGGLLDMILLFNVDLYSDAHAGYRASVNAMLDERNGLFV